MAGSLTGMKPNPTVSFFVIRGKHGVMCNTAFRAGYGFVLIYIIQSSRIDKGLILFKQIFDETWNFGGEKVDQKTFLLPICEKLSPVGWKMKGMQSNVPVPWPVNWQVAIVMSSVIKFQV